MSGVVHPWIFARKGAKLALERAEQEKNGSFYNCITCLFMTHTALDGYLYTLSRDLLSLTQWHIKQPPNYQHLAYALEGHIERCNFNYNTEKLSQQLSTLAEKVVEEWHDERDNAYSRYKKINALLGIDSGSNPYQKYLGAIETLSCIRNEIAHPKPQHEDMAAGIPEDYDECIEETWPNAKYFRPEKARHLNETIMTIIEDLNMKAHGSLSNLESGGWWCGHKQK